MGARTKARKRALDMLFIADVRQSSLDEILREEGERAAAQPQRSSSWPYAYDIVRGVADNAVAIDRLIESHAVGWTLGRMPAVDRAILRVAVWELVHNPDVPAAVAIDEAVEFATVLSTDESSGFVNGVLGAIADDLHRSAS
ncbi:MULTISPECIES: transcription antitermination factor NusB [unclassified Microcella]|uniref:transcription antitermination factor NusB n=1 Tax=unclassified Microcella TaxID=2630066 RepID=UPI0006FF6BD5|nr:MULTISPECIES: transcription antitermination factor NusB [unclassified Microcella]KQV24991.1 N utilization substance protein B [Yonghaparkia sp. Root332]KRF31276.1 N utilization substance protein B [Yonghaparkia sp. Soil809]